MSNRLKNETSPYLLQHRDNPVDWYPWGDEAFERATSESVYLRRAKTLCHRVLIDFSDNTGGFYLYSDSHEELILRPKETYDGAIPGGNSLMCCNFIELSLLTDGEKYQKEAKKQIDFMTDSAFRYPAGYVMFLKALLKYRNPPVKITVVVGNNTDTNELVFSLPIDVTVVFLSEPTAEFVLKNGVVSLGTQRLCNVCLKL